MMQRPIKKLISDPKFYENEEINLRSALAFAALTTRNDNLENKLYEKVVKIPHYNTRLL